LQRDGGTLTVTQIAAGGSLNMSDLTLGTTTNPTNEFDFAYLGFPATKMINDLGAFNLNGSPRLSCAL